MERTGTGAVGLCVHVYCVPVKVSLGEMGRIGDRPKSQEGPFLIESDFLSFPQCLTGREKACDFSVCLLSIGLFYCFIFSSSSVYSGWVHAWEMRVGGNSEPCSGASRPPLRLSGLGWTSSCLPMPLSRELVTDPNYVPDCALGNLSLPICLETRSPWWL